jgi:hypothetical protein
LSFQSLVNTSQNSFFRPQSDFQQAVNDISKELWETWTGQAEKSQQIRDYLAPYLKSKNIQVTPRNSYYGVVDYPKNYGRFATASVWTLKENCVPCPDVNGGKCAGYKSKEQITEEYYSNIKEYTIDLIDAQRWGACLNHLTKSPKLSDPKMMQVDGGWRVAPRTVSIVVLYWYVQPREGTFVYTVTPGNPQTGAGDFLQYDANASVPLEWPETTLNYFLWKLATRYGVFIGNTFLSQFAKQQEAA